MSKSRQIYRATVEGAFWGFIFDLWVVILLGLVWLLVVPFQSTRELEWLALPDLAKSVVEYGRHHYSLPYFPDSRSLTAVLLSTPMLGGSALFVLCRLLVPLEISQSSSAIGWAFRAAMPNRWFVIFWLAFAVLIPLSTKVDWIAATFFTSTLIALVLLPLSVYKRNALEQAQFPNWWRPCFPGKKPLVLWLSLRVFQMLIPESAGWLPTYPGTSTAYGIAIALANEILKVLMAVVLIEKLSGAGVLRLLKQGRIVSLICAWLELSIRLVWPLIFLVPPILLLWLLDYFVIPQVQEASRATNTAMPNLLRLLSTIHFEGFELLPLIFLYYLVSLLAQGRLLILLGRNGVLPISNIGEFVADPKVTMQVDGSASTPLLAVTSVER